MAIAIFHRSRENNANAKNSKLRTRIKRNNNHLRFSSHKILYDENRKYLLYCCLSCFFFFYRLQWALYTCGLIKCLETGELNYFCTCAFDTCNAKRWKMSSILINDKMYILFTFFARFVLCYQQKKRIYLKFEKPITMWMG